MEQKNMSLKTKWISAALALGAMGAMIACMKAGDGMGLDTAGRVCTDASKDSACLPYINPCIANPSLLSCQVDPCVANPASKVCSTSVCAKDPTKPWCQSVDCATTPTAQVCADSCKAHPALAWCAAKVDCATTPTAQVCVDSCQINPALAWCGPVKTKFSEVYAIITASTCLQCHAPGQVGVTTGKLDMSSSDAAYANLVSVLVADQTLAPGWVRVLPGKPDSSMLYLKVAAAPTGFQPKLPNGTAYHDAMPLTGAPLTKAKLDLIKKWITDGAVK
jgi:hypothetical protein